MVQIVHDGTFKGSQSMARYEFAAMLYRAMQKGITVDGKLLKEFQPELVRSAELL